MAQDHDHMIWNTNKTYNGNRMIALGMAKEQSLLKPRKDSLQNN